MMHNMSHHFKASNTPHNPQPFKLWINLQVISPILLLTKHPQLSPAIYNSISQEKNHKKKFLKCIFIDTLNTKHKCFPCVFKLHRTDYRLQKNWSHQGSGSRVPLQLSGCPQGRCRMAPSAIWGGTSSCSDGIGAPCPWPRSSNWRQEFTT